MGEGGGLEKFGQTPYCHLFFYGRHPLPKQISGCVDNQRVGHELNSKILRSSGHFNHNQVICLVWQYIKKILGSNLYFSTIPGNGLNWEIELVKP